MEKYIVQTEHAPQAIGPYSQAVGFGNILFLSGQIALDPESGELVPGCVEGQTKQVMDNLRAVLEAANLTFDNVLKTTIFLQNMNDFAVVNAAYETYFEGNFPARACVEVSRLPKNVQVEMDMIAAFPTQG
jgi:2-iminobutanoate/2-iminopropanoate deaminase